MANKDLLYSELESKEKLFTALEIQHKRLKVSRSEFDKLNGPLATTYKQLLDSFLDVTMGYLIGLEDEITNDEKLIELVERNQD